MELTPEQKPIWVKILEIPKDGLRRPNMPTIIMIAECEALRVRATDDFEHLSKRGLTIDYILHMGTANDILRYAQTLWFVNYEGDIELQRQWREFKKEAQELRKKLILEFNHAFEEKPLLIDALKRYNKHTRMAQFTQDLANLSVIGTRNKELLALTNFDFTLLNKSMEYAHEMGHLFAKATYERTTPNPHKINRDRAFWYLFPMFKKIRKTGKFVFNDFPKHRRDAYKAHYFSEKKQKQRKALKIGR